jgi:hypothetical protein
VSREVFSTLKMHLHVSPHSVYLIKVSMERGTSRYKYIGHPLSQDSDKLFLSARYKVPKHRYPSISFRIHETFL